MVQQLIMILLKDIYLSTPSIEKRGEKLKKKRIYEGFFSIHSSLLFFSGTGYTCKKKKKNSNSSKQLHNMSHFTQYTTAFAYVRSAAQSSRIFEWKSATAHCFSERP